MGSTAAAVVLLRERQIVERFQYAAATAPERARVPAELGVHGGIAFDRLRSRAVLREAAPQVFYLDEASWAALRRLRRRVAVVVLILVGVAIVMGWVTMGR